MQEKILTQLANDVADILDFRSAFELEHEKEECSINSVKKLLGMPITLKYG